MAEDIAIRWDNELFEGDIEAVLGELTREEGLITAVYMSLFTNRRASIDDDLPDPSSGDRQGWWGDQLATEPGDQIGSLLWLLARSKTTKDTLIRAESYIKDALSWMVDDGIAARVVATVERIDRADRSAILAARIEIHQSSGSVIALRFDDLWKATLGI